MGYSCKQCGAPASVTPDGRITRSCEHTGTVAASMSAVAYGRGHVSEAQNPVLRFLHALGLRIMGGGRGVR
jgi:hypothetical protein